MKINLFVKACLVVFNVEAFKFQHIYPRHITKLKSVNDVYTSVLDSNVSKNIPYSNQLVVQGDSLKTWSCSSPLVDQIQVDLSTEGRPLDANIELWNGPDNTPCKMRVYVENGQLTPFSTVVKMPNSPNTIAIRNSGQLELPFVANVYETDVNMVTQDCIDSSTIIQGGSLRTYQFEPFVESAAIYMKTDGRPLNSRIELLQGPNNNKQVIELYAEDGFNRPFFCVLKTPGSGNVIRIVNTAPIEFPITAGVVSHTTQK